MRLCVVTRAPTADGQKTGLLQPSPPSPPPGLCVPMLGGSRLYKGGGYWPPWGKWWQLSDFHFKARGRANFETSVQAPAKPSEALCAMIDARIGTTKREPVTPAGERRECVQNRTWYYRVPPRAIPDGPRTAYRFTPSWPYRYRLPGPRQGRGVFGCFGCAAPVVHEKRRGGPTARGSGPPRRVTV